MTPPATILVYVGLDAVGDGLMKLAFLRALRAAFPAARITWMAGKGHSVYAGVLAPVVAGLLDEVLDDCAIGSKVSELFGRSPLGGRHFDLIIDTQRRLLTSLIVRRIGHGHFVSAAAGFRLSAFRPKAGYQRPRAMAGQLMDLLNVLPGGIGTGGSAALAVDEAIEAVADRLLPPGPVYVGFAPGAGGRNKCWPLDRFIAVAQAQLAAGRIPVFLLGPNEGEWAASIARHLPQALLPLQAASPVTPMLTIALGRRLMAMVANDSGTGHMLALSDRPLISLFGPTPAAKFAPAALTAKVISAQNFGGEAMTAIPTQAVADAIDEMLAL